MASDTGDARPWHQIVTQRIVIVSLVAFLVGLGLLYFGGRNDLWQHHHGLQALVNGLAGMLIVSVGLGVLWQLVGKRAFTREILETATATTDLEAAGVTRIGMNYREIPDWATLFADVSKLDIFLAYGRTWRNMNLERLRETAKRPKSRIRVYLPDPADPMTVAHLANRFEMEESKLIDAINEARTVYETLALGEGSVVEVYVRAGATMFSAYRFDNTAVVTLYSHQRKRLDVPTFVCRSGGFLYRFLRDELEAIHDQSSLTTPSSEDQGAS